MVSSSIPAKHYHPHGVKGPRQGVQCTLLRRFLNGAPEGTGSMKAFISEACHGQVLAMGGAISLGYISFVSEAISLHCQQKSKGGNGTWFYTFPRHEGTQLDFLTGLGGVIHSVSSPQAPE